MRAFDVDVRNLQRTRAAALYLACHGDVNGNCGGPCVGRARSFRGPAPPPGVHHFDRRAFPETMASRARRGTEDGYPTPPRSDVASPEPGGTLGRPPLRRRGYELTAWNESSTAGDHTTTGCAASRTGRAVPAAGSVTVNVDPRPGALFTST